MVKNLFVHISSENLTKSAFRETNHIDLLLFLKEVIMLYSLFLDIDLKNKCHLVNI